jgi:hypothetical protein
MRRQQLTEAQITAPIARWRAIAVTQGFGHPQFQALREETSYAGLRRAGFPDE